MDEVFFSSNGNRNGDDYKRIKSLLENEVHKSTEVEYSDYNFKLDYLGDFKRLDDTKKLLDQFQNLNDDIRRASMKYVHQYELVKVLCIKNIISRAYFKLYEIIYFEKFIYKTIFDCFFICEAPGGFINCIQDIRSKKRLNTKYVTVSKDNSDIYFDKTLDKDNIILGDITNFDTLINIKNRVLEKFPDKLDFITADGGFDIKDFNAQEIILSKLLLCEIYLALSLQKTGGNFVIKFYDMFSHNSIIYFLILNYYYESVKICKPNCSRNTNSERYILCLNFRGLSDNLLINTLEEIVKDYKLELVDNLIICTKVFPDLDMDSDYLDSFIKRITKFNNEIIKKQVMSLKKAYKFINSRDTYMNNMYLKIFNKKLLLADIILYKNILYDRIKSALTLLKIYKIQYKTILDG